MISVRLSDQFIDDSQIQYGYLIRENGHQVATIEIDDKTVSLFRSHEDISSKFTFESADIDEEVIESIVTILFHDNGLDPDIDTVNQIILTVFPDCEV